MQETQRIPRREGTSFFTIDDVIRNAGYCLGPLGRRTQSVKGTNNRHRSSYQMPTPGDNSLTEVPMRTKQRTPLITGALRSTRIGNLVIQAYAVKTIRLGVNLASLLN